MGKPTKKQPTRSASSQHAKAAAKTLLQRAAYRLDLFLSRFQRHKKTPMSKAVVPKPVRRPIQTARDFGIQDDSAFAPPQSDEQLQKAYALRESLQKSIAEIDQRLFHDLPQEERSQLLATHLDCLIKADALSSKLKHAEQVAIRQKGC